MREQANASLTLDHRLTSTNSPEGRLRTIYLFGVLTLVSAALVWANNEFVMTKEVLSALAGIPQNSFQVDMQYESIRQMTTWGYIMAPIQLACRIGFAALLVQMLCLLDGREIPFEQMFRITAIAYCATLFGSILQVFWITQQPATAITQASLGIVPDSLAAWFGATSDAPSLLHLVLSRVSITSLLWMVLLYWGLRQTNRLRAVGAATVTATTWLVMSGLQVGTSLFVQKLAG